MAKKNSAYRKLYPSKLKTMPTWIALSAMVIRVGIGAVLGNALTLKPAPIVPGDVATYRCEDCLDRWDLIVPGADDDTGFDLDLDANRTDTDRYDDRYEDR